MSLTGPLYTFDAVYGLQAVAGTATGRATATGDGGFQAIMQNALGSKATLPTYSASSPAIPASAVFAAKLNLAGGASTSQTLASRAYASQAYGKASATRTTSQGQAYRTATDTLADNRALGLEGLAAAYQSTVYRPNRETDSGSGTEGTTSLGSKDAVALGSAISSYDGDYFTARVSLSEPEVVGEGVEQFHFVHLVEKDGTYYGYFIDHTGGSENDVGLATSTDGVNFAYQGKVLVKGESGFDALQASFPDVQYDEDTQTWYMLYEAKADTDDTNSVCLATSPDGVNWTKQGPVIEPGDAGETSSVDVGTPTMFKEDGVWHVYFHTLASDGRVRIGYASGSDLGDLTVSQEPLLDTDAEGSQAGTVGARSNVVKVGDYYYMAYEVCTATTDFDEAWWGTSLARATSPDGPWEKLSTGSILANETPGMGKDGPELSVQDGKLYLYYRHGANATARVEVTGLASGATTMAMAGAATSASA